MPKTGKYQSKRKVQEISTVDKIYKQWIRNSGISGLLIIQEPQREMGFQIKKKPWSKFQ